MDNRITIDPKVYPGQAWLMHMRIKALLLPISSLALLLTIILSSADCASDNTPSPIRKNNLDSRDYHLWSLTVKPYLQDPLWVSRDIYDAGHFLMIPLHVAFSNMREDWQRQFSEHFFRFVSTEPAGVDQGELNRLHYFYLASRFIVLAQEKEREELIPRELPQIIYSEVKYLWNEKPAWQWGRAPFPGGIQERVSWKLTNKIVARSYYRAIIDHELFLFAIAADLYAYEKLLGNEPSSVLADILALAHRVFQEEIVYQRGGGWLLQPGVWTDHPDFAFAGREEKIPGMEPLPVPGIASDSSHSHRFPLWLTSLENAYRKDSMERWYYRKLKRGLEKQLFDEVIVMPSDDFPAYRMRNFMDGRNGVYRWGYVTLGVNNGYGPFELSGTFLLGWWRFLNTHRIRFVYRDFSTRFPLPPDVIATYIGPGGTRERHPLVANTPSAYNHGFLELLVRLAGKLHLINS